MKKFLLSMALVAIAGAGTQASAQTAPANAINGKFSVAADKQVYFSQGNLQYTQSTATWAFAEHQYDILGDANITVADDLADRIDLFGWSADNTTAPFGIRLSTDNADYAGAFVDWGTNTIGTDAPNTWRTLTKDEWEYLLTTRANAAERMGVARINLNDAGSEFANGVILLPDDWTCPAGVTFKSGHAASDSEAAYGEYQTFTLAQWQALEEAGAVFLPAAGDWKPADTYVGRINQYGYVHTATTHDSLEAYNVSITSDRAAYTNWDDRKARKSVRLVQDVKAVGTGIAEADVTGNVETRKVLRDGQILIQRGDQTYTVMGTTSK